MDILARGLTELLRRADSDSDSDKGDDAGQQLLKLIQNPFGGEVRDILWIMTLLPVLCTACLS